MRRLFENVTTTLNRHLPIAVIVLSVTVNLLLATFPAQWDPKLGIHVT